MNTMSMGFAVVMGVFLPLEIKLPAGNDGVLASRFSRPKPREFGGPHGCSGGHGCSSSSSSYSSSSSSSYTTPPPPETPSERRLREMLDEPQHSWKIGPLPGETESQRRMRQILGNSPSSGYPPFSRFPAGESDTDRIVREMNGGSSASKFPRTKPFDDFVPKDPSSVPLTPRFQIFNSDTIAASRLLNQEISGFEFDFQVPKDKEEFNQVYGPTNIYSSTTARQLDADRKRIQKLTPGTVNSSASPAAFRERLRAMAVDKVMIVCAHSIEINAEGGAKLAFRNGEKIPVSELHREALDMRKRIMIVTCHSAELKLQAELTFAEAAALCEKAVATLGEGEYKNLRELRQRAKTWFKDLRTKKGVKVVLIILGTVRGADPLIIILSGGSVDNEEEQKEKTMALPPSKRKPLLSSPSLKFDPPVLPKGGPGK